MTRRPLKYARLAVFAVLLCVAAPARKDTASASPIEPARARYKPAAIVPALGIRG